MCVCVRVQYFVFFAVRREKTPVERLRFHTNEQRKKAPLRAHNT